MTGIVNGNSCSALKKIKYFHSFQFITLVTQIILNRKLRTYKAHSGTPHSCTPPPYTPPVRRRPLGGGTSQPREE